MATDGNQGAGAKARARCGAEHTATEPTPRELALFAVELGRDQLARHAFATDDPEPGMVEAADLLDAAADYLRGGCCQPLEAGRGGEA